MKIIDVSYHNGKIDFERVKAAGIDGVIIRAGYGQNHIDKKFKDNIKGAIAAGLPVGVYWFSYAYSVGMVKAEAKHCLAAIKPYSIDLGVFFDWEYDSAKYAKNRGVTPNKKLVTLFNKVFCSAIRSAGYKAGFYFNKDYASRYIDVDAIDGIRWYARYASAAGRDCDIWQYTSAGKIDGISGKVDVNKVINKSLFTAGKKSDSSSSGSSSAKIKSNVDIAKEVLAGKWGDGDARKYKLKAAGYDYDVIQKLVNESLEHKTTVTYYRIKTGDTLTSIAKKYNTTVKALVKLNSSISDPNKIYAGQQIRIK